MTLASKLTGVLQRLARAAGRFSFPVLIAFFAAAAAMTAQAEDARVHHFEIRVPSQVRVDQPARFKITARLADRALAREAGPDLLVQMTTSRGTRTQEARLRRGEAEIDLTFDQLGLVIVQVTDKANPAVFNSEIVRVQPASEGPLR